MKKQAATLTTILTALILGASIFLSFWLIQLSQQRQHYSHDLAELTHIKYGLLNAAVWKEKAGHFLQKKLASFQLEGQERQQLQLAIEYALGQMLDELDSYMRRDSTKDNWGAKLKGFLHENALKPINLRAKIPAIAERTMQELDKEEVQQALKGYISKQIDQLRQEAVLQLDSSTQQYILQQYGLKEVKDAQDFLSKKIIQLQNQLWRWALIFLGVVLIGFLAWWLSPQNSWLQFTILCLITLFLLVAGLWIPMIDIDARILSLYFELLGEEIRFEDQLLFFQSKSIMDVIYLLLFKGDASTFFVGLLILSFSVIFPLLKIIAAIITFKRIRALKINPILRFLVLKSGKWSMADVMVVAIFMAFIGFRGILNAQLGQLEQAKDIHILSTDQYTSLQPGILLFSCFCMASLFLAVFIQKRFDQLGES